MKKTYDAKPAGLTRRQSLLGLAPVLAAGFLVTRHGFAATPATGDAVSELKRLEQREGGRLGVAVIDTASGGGFGWRQDERFALCSTFKFALAAAILQRMDAGSISLDRAVAIAKGDLLGNSPVTEKHVGATLSVGELCHATMTESDNAAANLLLKELGGPEAVTAFLRGLGDDVTRLDGIEPGMNNPDIVGGEIRDTTTPAAMAATMRTIVLGEVLTEASRAILTGWMKAARTGRDRLRAGFPKDWTMGDKTGTGGKGQTNDIAVAWPPGRAPLIVTVYYERAGRTMKENAAVLAEVGRIVGRFA